jgi:protein-S-isoprenylcysteine O-methyltransferase Ste14
MPLATISRSIVLQTLASLVVAAILIFLPAGTLAWPQAWVLLALFFGSGQAIGFWLVRKDPALLAERMKPPLSAEQKPRDRAVMGVLLIAFLLWFVAMGLDHRFGWSHTPLWAQAGGVVLILATFWGWVRVLATNSFASTNITLQTGRGQSVITTGPYAVVRHPMYADALLFMIGAPLLLGSLWGLLGLVLFVPLLAARALGEETMLMTGLDGYPGYAQKVRFRLVPGVW